MRKIENCEYYFFKHQNDKNFNVCLYRVLFGVRIVIEIDGDKISLPLSLCAGSELLKQYELYTIIYQWLATNPEDTTVMCSKLMRAETSRPYGNSKELIDALDKLPKSNDTVSFTFNDFVKGIGEMYEFN